MSIKEITMKAGVSGLSLLTLVALAGCSTAPVAVTPVVLPAEPSVAPPLSGPVSTVFRTARTTCTRYQSLLSLAALVPGEKVATIVSYVRGVCDELLVGQVPPTLDANTPNWLQRNLDSLAALVHKRQL